MFVILPDGKQVMGAALATMLSNLVVAVYFIITYQKSEKDTVLRLGMKGEYPSRESFSAIFGVGIPVAVGVLLFDLCNNNICRDKKE